MSLSLSVCVCVCLSIYHTNTYHSIIERREEGEEEREIGRLSDDQREMELITLRLGSVWFDLVLFGFVWF